MNKERKKNARQYKAGSMKEPTETLEQRMFMSNENQPGKKIKYLKSE